MNAAVPQRVPVPQLLADPRWFLAGLDGPGGVFNFLYADHATLAREAFLDRRWAIDRLLRCDVAIGELLSSAPLSLPRTKVNFLWHTGFCCSTLIARLLDMPGRNLSLSEPMVFTTLADISRAGAFPDRGTLMRFCQVILHLLGRPHEPGASVTIKPAPVSSCLLGEAAALTSGKMLLLHSDCRSFVVSAMSKGEDGKGYVRRMLEALTIDGLRPDGRDDLSDLEAAALVWRMQVASFGRHKLGASLDCDAFLAAPHEAMAKIDAFYGLGLGAARIAKVLDGPLFRHNAKDASQSFDAARRREEHDTMSRELGPALDDAVAWSAQFFPDAAFPNPLLETSA